MNKKNIITILIIVIIIAGAIFAANSAGFFKKSEPEQVAIPEGIILFYGIGCPHCETLEQWMAQANIEQELEAKELKLTKLEVFNDKANYEILSQAAKACSYNDQIGVPFLWDGEGSCIIGDEPIEEFFMQKIGLLIQTNDESSEISE